MSFNATILGQMVFFLAIVMVVFSYILGKRKTETPKITAFVGLLTAFVPPLAIVFLMVLVLKSDVQEKESKNA